MLQNLWLRNNIKEKLPWKKEELNKKETFNNQDYHLIKEITCNKCSCNNGWCSCNNTKWLCNKEAWCHNNIWVHTNNSKIIITKVMIKMQIDPWTIIKRGFHNKWINRYINNKPHYKLDINNNYNNNKDNNNLNNNHNNNKMSIFKINLNLENNHLTKDLILVKPLAVRAMEVDKELIILIFLMVTLKKTWINS